jgi:broad specificity phosphatase PhoE
MTSVYLIRHGDSIDGQVNGHGPKMDLGLSADGRNQAKALKGPERWVLESSTDGHHLQNVVS